MDRPPSTAKPSAVLKSLSPLELECLHSVTFHAEGIPLLVSPKLLRTRDLGQIDLARLKKDRLDWVVEIAEVKSSNVGDELLVRGQRRRLFAAQSFLGAVFGHRTRFVRLIGE